MRLWHYKLITFLPKSQLLAQWRELNSIFKKQDRHILINYIYEYPKENLKLFADQVLDEMDIRGYKVKSLDNYLSYFGENRFIIIGHPNPFHNHHDFFYLRQCYYNLEEKFMRGQRDFDGETMRDLATFYEAEYAKFKGERK